MINMNNVKTLVLSTFAFCLVACGSHEESTSIPSAMEESIKNIQEYSDENNFSSVYELNGSNSAMSTAQTVELNSKIHGSFFSEGELDIDIFKFECKQGVSPKISVISLDDRDIYQKIFTDNEGEVFSHINIESFKFDVLIDDQCYILLSPLDDQYSEYEITLISI